jgi:protein SSD1
MLQIIAQKLRAVRYGLSTENIPSLRLLYQLDDENVPVEHNIFDSTPAHEIIEELSYKANAFVADKISKALPEKAFLRRHAPPKAGRLQTFGERMTKVGYEIDTSSSAALQNSLFKVEDANMRKVGSKLPLFP